MWKIKRPTEVQSHWFKELELEVMGIHCAKAKSVPDDWFFVRHGGSVTEAVTSWISVIQR